MLSISGLSHVNVVKGSSTWLCRRTKSSCPEIHGESGLAGAYIPPTDKKPLPRNCYHYMFETISKQDRQVTIVCTAALTNIAIFLLAFPEAKQSIEKIVLLGGAIGIGNISPAAEWNIMCDPEAARVVFNSGLKIVMIPLEVSHTILSSPDILARIEGELEKSKFSQLLIDLILFFKASYYNVFHFENPPLHDPLAVAYVIDPSLFEVTPLHVDIEIKSEFCDGRTVCDIFDINKKPKDTLVARKIFVDRFWDVLLSALKKANQQSYLNFQG